MSQNAIKFSSQNSEVNLFVFNLNAKPNKTVVRFVIFDQGIGISEADHGKLFEAFSQIDASTSRKHSGSGLGLSISRHLLNLMGGQIGLFSRPENGTAFWFDVSFACNIIEQPVLFENFEKLEIIFTGKQLLNFELFLQAIGIKCKRVRSKDSFKLRSQKFKQIFIDDLPSQFATSKPSRLFNRLMETAGLPYRIESFRSGNEKNLVRKNSFSATLEKCGTALLVEDHTMNQIIGRLQLESLGFKVDICSNGIEALQAIIQKKYSVVFMDCQLPDMDGYTITREIRNLEQNIKYRVPIIALTASALDGEKERCIAAGMDDYLSKPVDLQLLYEICKKWLQLTEHLIEQKPNGSMGSLFPIIDLEKLEKTFSLDQCSELLQIFLTDTEDTINKLDYALTEKDYKTGINLSHTLKGASRMIYSSLLGNTSEGTRKSFFCKQLGNSLQNIC